MLYSEKQISIQMYFFIKVFVYTVFEASASPSMSCLRYRHLLAWKDISAGPKEQVEEVGPRWLSYHLYSADQEKVALSGKHIIKKYSRGK